MKQSFTILFLFCIYCINASIDTSYYSVSKDSLINVSIDTTFDNSNVDSIYFCHTQTPQYGSLSFVVNDSEFDYTAGTTSGIDTLCSVVQFSSGVLDTTEYIISVLPTTDTLNFNLDPYETESICYTNEIGAIDNIEISEQIFGSLSNIDSLNACFDYGSPPYTILDSFCLIVHGTNNLSDTTIIKIDVDALVKPNIVQSEFYIDQDPGYGNGYPLSFTSDSLLDISFHINTDTLSQGMHLIYVRSKDASGNWSYPQEILFYHNKAAEYDGLAFMEYYFDVDPGHGNGQFLPSSNDSLIDFSTNIDISELTDGLHTLFVRTRNNLNQWGFPASLTFLKLSGDLLSNDIIAMEYFIDTDPGISMGTPISITPNDSLDFTFNVDLTNISTGAHKVSVRAQQENGLWSYVQSTTFIVVQNSINEKDIVQLEYFFDINPGYGNGIDIPISANDSIETVAPISLSGLSTGIHNLYVRAKDENNQWSLLYMHEIDVTESDALYPEIEYFPSGISMTADNCYDIVIDSFYIINTGSNPLNFNIIDQTSWLSYSQTLGSVPNMDSLLITVEANPMGLTSAQNLIDVQISSNAGTSPDTTITINLNVPLSNYSLTFSDSLFNFDDTQVNSTNEEEVVLTNTSCNAIQIDSIKTTSTFFVASVWDSLVLQNDSLLLEVNFNPDTIGVFEDSLFIYSQAGIDTLTLQAEAVGIPIINFKTDSLHVEFPNCIADTSLSFYIKNEGLGPLYWEYISNSLPSWSSMSIESDTIDPSDSTLLFLSIIDASLDNGTYTYDLGFSSNDTLTPLATLPLIIEVEGDAFVTCSDTLLDCGIVTRNTSVIINTNVLNEGCDDLIISSIDFNTNIFSSNVSSVFLPTGYSYPIYIEFEPPYAGTFTDTMTVASDIGVLKVPITGIGDGALTQSLSALFLEKTIPSCQGMYVDSLYIYNVGDGTGDWSILNSNDHPNWISLSTLSDSLAPGDSSLVEINYDATGLFNNTYTTTLDIEFSDPITPNVNVPITLIATGGSQMAISKDSIDFEYSYITRHQKDTLQLINTGCDTFHVVSVNHNATFNLSDTLFDVMPYDTLDIGITFKPDQIQTYTDTIFFNGLSDTLSCIVHGQGIDIPQISKFTNDSLIIKMPVDILSTTVADSTWHIWGEKTGLRSGTYNVQNGNELLFVPDDLFRAGEEISMTISSIAYTDSIQIQSYNIESKAPVNNPTDAVFKVLPIPGFITNYTTGAYLYFSDVNRDNLVDILISKYSTSPNVDIYFQDASGYFSFNATYPNSGTNVFLENTPDLNNDGFPDLLFGHRSSVPGIFSFRLNNGDGTFGSSQSFNTASYPIHANIAISKDWDADGDIDILSQVAGTIDNPAVKLRIYSNDGSASLNLHSTLQTTLSGTGYTTTDFDKNGFQDFCYQTYQSLYSIDQLRSYDNEEGYLSSIVSQNTGKNGIFFDHFNGDLNHDNIKDIIYKKHGDTYIIYSDSLSFPNYNHRILLKNEDIQSFVEDFNGDGLNDILAFNRRVGADWGKLPVEIALNNTQQNFEFENRGFQAGLFQSLNSCDIDNDGDIDIPFLDSLGQLWIAYNENSNAEISFSNDSLQYEIAGCDVDTSFNLNVYNTGDSTLVWHINQTNQLPSWMSIDTTDGQILTSDSLELVLSINTNGLIAGNYSYDLLFASNDTSSFEDVVHVEFELISDTLLSISSPDLDFGFVDTSQVYSLDLIITNDGCEDVNIDSSFVYGNIFETSTLPVVVPAFGTHTLTVSIDADSLITYMDTLVLTHNYGIFEIPLSAIGCYGSPLTFVEEIVCEQSEVGIDTTILSNISGCDSIIITNHSLPWAYNYPDMVAYYPFNGNAQDETGNGHNADHISATLATDRFGLTDGCYYFNGSSSSYIKIPHHTDLNLGGSFTISAWVYGEPTSGTSSIISKGRDIIDGTYSMRKWYMSCRNGGAHHTASAGITDGSWHHLVYVVDSENDILKAYTDGVLVDQNAFPDFQTNNTYPLVFGRHFVSATGGSYPYPYKGKLDDIRIFDRDFSSEEVFNLYNQESGNLAPIVFYASSCDTSMVKSDSTIVADQYGCDSLIINITSLQNAISSDSSIIFYPLDGNTDDLGGRDLHGVNNGASMIQNRFGESNKAMDFDGSDDWINADLVLSEIQTGMDMSMSFWFNTTDSPSTIHGNLFLAANQYNGSPENVFRLGTSQSGAIFLSPTSGSYHELGTGFNDGLWHHLTIRHNGSTSLLEVYVDNIKAGAVSNFIIDWSIADRFNIGQEYDGSNKTDFYNGSLDQLHIYKRFLETGEIQQLYYEVNNDDEILIEQDTLLDFGVVTLGDSLSITTIISNASCDTISIDSIYTTHPTYTVNVSNIDLLPYQSVPIEVQFLPESSLLYVSELRVESNMDSLSIDLTGLACYAPPVLSYTDTTSICDGQYFTLTTDQNISLTWSNGFVGDTLLVSDAGTYYGITSNGNGCILYTDSVEVIKVPNPNIVNNGFSTLCVGDSTLLEVLHSNTYYWSTGDSTQSLWVMPSMSETYTVTTTNDLGCTFINSVLIHVIPPDTPGVVTNMIPYDGTIDEGQSVQFSWLPSENASTYDLYLWLDSGTKPSTPTYSNLNQISKTIDNLQLGTTYRWQVHAKNSCFETEGPQQTFTTKLLPDLIVQNVTVPSSAFSGTSITVSWEVKNVGSGDTGSTLWYDLVGLSEDNIDQTDGGIDPLVASDINVTALSSGQSYTNTATFTLPQGISGNYFIFVRTDALGIKPKYNIEELDESNNNNQFGAYIPINLTPPPDLKVTHSLQPNNTFSGQSITVEYTVKNDGTGSTLLPVWEDRIYISEDSIRNGNDVLLKFNGHSGILTVNQTYIEVVDINIPANLSGSYYLIYETDVHDQIYEFIYEDNNVHISPAFNILQTPPADLIPVSLTIPDTIHSDETIFIDWQVKNIGANPTNVSNWKDKLYLTKEDSFSLSQSILLHEYYHNGILEIDSVYNVSRSLQITQDIDSSYNLFILTDEADNLVELYENNNVFGPIPCFIKTPDLALDSIQFTKEVFAGETSILHYKVGNIGNGHLIERTVQDKIYASTDTILDLSLDSLIGTQSATLSLNNEEWLDRNCEITFAEGIMDSFYIVIVTDYPDLIYEDSLELNNTIISDSLIIVNRPDYPDLKGLVMTAPDTIQAGVPFTLTYTVTNAAIGALQNKIWTDKLFISLDSLENGVEFGSHTLNQNLESGINYTVDLTYVVAPNTLEGLYNILLSIDDENTVYEFDKEGNNLDLKLDSIFILAKPKSDLEISASTFLPDTIYSSMNIDVDLTVTNAGIQTATQFPWVDNLYFSVDTILSPDDILIDSKTRYSLLDTNQVYNINFEAQVPDGTSGPFYFIAKTDVFNENGEIDTLNNLAILTNQGGTGGNGTTADSTVILLSPYPDLELIALSASTTVTEGQTIELVYTVQNNGDTIIQNRTWNDRVYLSTNTTPNGLTIFNTSISHTLNIGDTYTDTLEIDIPLDNVGNYYVVLKTDANNNIYEHLDENNNDNAVLLTVLEAPPADAFVENINCSSDTTKNGVLVTVRWDTKNLGLNPINGNMYEAVYFSSDSIWDVADPLMYSAQLPSNIAPLAKVSRTANFVVDNASYGYQYILVRTDLRDNIDENNEENNISVGQGIFVDVNILPIDILTWDTLQSNKNLFYRVEVVDSLIDETLKITLTGDTIFGYNESYVRFDDLPSRYNYEYSHSEAFMGQQQVIVSDIEAGNYFNLSYGTTTSNGDQDVSLLAEIQPFEIFKVVSNEGSNTGQVTVKIEGARFEPDMTAILCNDSLGNILIALETVFVSPTIAYATFDLTGSGHAGHHHEGHYHENGLDTGYYDLKLKKLDGELAILDNGFHVIESSNDNIKVKVIYPDRMRPFRTAAIQIEYANTSGKDIPVPQFLVVSLENVPIGKTENEVNNISGWSWGQNLPAGYREVLIELRDPENYESKILRAGQEGVITFYARLLATGQYSFKVIDLK